MISDLKKYYQERFADYSYSVEAVQYPSRAEQELRFRLLARDIAATDFVVDVGCGFGDMLKYLRGIGFTGQYLGLDFVDEFIASARKIHQQDAASNFRVYNVLEDGPLPDCDVAVQSGIFNNALPEDQNWAFVTKCLKKMAAASRKSIAFNALSTLVEFRDPDLFYTDPGEVMKICRSLMPFVSMRQDYVLREGGYPYELTVYASHSPIPLSETT